MGDIGFMDGNLNLHIVGRKKELLKYKSLYVFPSELQNLINEMDLVFDSCIVGLTSEETGIDTVYAVVRRMNESLTEECVINYVNGKKIHTLSSWRT